MIPFLLDLTLRGTLATMIVVGLDLALTRRMRPAWRRVWWILAVLAWLVPLRLPTNGYVPQLPALTVPGLTGNASAPARPEGAPDVASPARADFPWLGIVTWAVGTGAACTFLLLLWRTARTSRRWSRERLSTDPELLGLLEDCKAIAGVTAPIGLVLTHSVPTPALLGWLRPRILLPERLASVVSRDQLRSILLHELAHFRANDIPLNWLFSLALALHWFNPFAHLAVRRWRQFREVSADAAVLGWLPAGTTEVYGQALIDSLRHAGDAPVPRGALALSESLKLMHQRLALVGSGGPRAGLAWLGVFVALALVAGLALPSRALPPVPDGRASAAEAATLALAGDWLALLDRRDFARSWQELAPAARKAATQQSWETACVMKLEGFGACRSRELKTSTYRTSIPGPDGRVHRGEFVFLQYDSTYEKIPAARDSLVFVKGDDGRWRPTGYLVTLR